MIIRPESLRRHPLALETAHRVKSTVAVLLARCGMLAPAAAQTAAGYDPAATFAPLTLPTPPYL